MAQPDQVSHTRLWPPPLEGTVDISHLGGEKALLMQVDTNMDTPWYAQNQTMHAACKHIHTGLRCTFIIVPNHARLSTLMQITYSQSLLWSECERYPVLFETNARRLHYWTCWPAEAVFCFMHALVDVRVHRGPPVVSTVAIKHKYPDGFP